MLTVADTGPGIDDTVKSKLFEPYYTTRQRGLGLGLANVKELVQLAGGIIELDSEPGRGCTFRIFLPAQHTMPPIVDGTGLTAIVADDDPVQRELMKNVLESVGFDVSVAADADEARQLASWLKDDLHLLVTDVVMPGRGGRRLAEHLRHTWPDLGVVYVSGYPQLPGPMPRQEAFVPKPLAAKHLLAAVLRVMPKAAVARIGRGDPIA